MGIHLAEARVDLDQLRTNIQTVQAHVGDTQLLVPVKGDGYGHGAVEIARTIESLGVAYLGVANLYEAIELRDAGIQAPILILSASHPQHADRLIETDVSVTVSTYELARALERAAAERDTTVTVHVKVDTGMGRNGVLADEASAFVRFLREQCPHLSVEGIFSHFSVSFSEAPDDRAYTRQQIATFNGVLDGLEAAGLRPPLCHIANSAGLIQYEDEVTSGHYNMVRTGILTYGYPEVRQPWTEPVQPIMNLVTWVVSLKALPPGSDIGYGRRYTTSSTEHIATLSIGYADGLPPGLANNGDVLIHGERAPIVGSVSMDQMTVNVSGTPDVAIGDEAIIMNGHQPADAVADRLRTGFTEVVLTALSPRVARVYFGRATTA